MGEPRLVRPGKYHEFYEGGRRESPDFPHGVELMPGTFLNSSSSAPNHRCAVQLYMGGSVVVAEGGVAVAWDALR